MSPEEIIQRIQSNYPGAEVSSDGADCKFSVTIISDSFEGKSPIQRQRPIMALFKDEIANGSIHALSLTVKTTSE